MTVNYPPNYHQHGLVFVPINMTSQSAKEDLNAITCIDSNHRAIDDNCLFYFFQEIKRALHRYFTPTIRHKSAYCPLYASNCTL